MSHVRVQAQVRLVGYSIPSIWNLASREIKWHLKIGEEAYDFELHTCKTYGFTVAVECEGEETVDAEMIAEGLRTVPAQLSLNVWNKATQTYVSHTTSAVDIANASAESPSGFLEPNLMEVRMLPPGNFNETDITPGGVNWDRPIVVRLETSYLFFDEDAGTSLIIAGLPRRERVEGVVYTPPKSPSKTTLSRLSQPKVVREDPIDDPGRGKAMSQSTLKRLAEPHDCSGTLCTSRECRRRRREEQLQRAKLQAERQQRLKGPSFLHADPHPALRKPLTDRKNDKWLRDMQDIRNRITGVLRKTGQSCPTLPPAKIEPTRLCAKSATKAVDTEKENETQRAVLQNLRSARSHSNCCICRRRCVCPTSTACRSVCLLHPFDPKPSREIQLPKATVDGFHIENAYANLPMKLAVHLHAIDKAVWPREERERALRRVQVPLKKGWEDVPVHRGRVFRSYVDYLHNNTCDDTQCDV